ncbi:SAM-dependent methyltransferase [Nocardiopsis alba]|uniref:SAM-dependent methyltransferase n=1 Tax=Nocardiopsis alba TaxID=53437 RepID=UPI00364CB268
MTATGTPAATMDTTKPSAARMYDYYLGGTHNFPADRELAEQVIASLPDTPRIMRENRAFLQAAVAHCARAGIRQFIDLGAGIPTQGPVHETARAIAPDCRVVYCDIEETAVTYGRRILADDDACGFVHADLRDREGVLAHPETARLIDFDRPVALLMLSVLQFLPDRDDPAGTVAAYRDRLAPGSMIALSHATDEAFRDRSDGITSVYRRSSTPISYRSREEIADLFTGLELVPPGVVPVPVWGAGPAPAAREANGFCGVGVKKP